MPSSFAVTIAFLLLCFGASLALIITGGVMYDRNVLTTDTSVVVVVEATQARNRKIAIVLMSIGAAGAVASLVAGSIYVIKSERTSGSAVPAVGGSIRPTPAASSSSTPSAAATTTPAASTVLVTTTPATYTDIWMRDPPPTLTAAPISTTEEAQQVLASLAPTDNESIYRIMKAYNMVGMRPTVRGVQARTSIFDGSAKEWFDNISQLIMNLGSLNLDIAGDVISNVETINLTYESIQDRVGGITADGVLYAAVNIGNRLLRGVLGATTGTSRCYKICHRMSRYAVADGAYLITCISSDDCEPSENVDRVVKNKVGRIWGALQCYRPRYTFGVLIAPRGERAEVTVLSQVDYTSLATITRVVNWGIDINSMVDTVVHIPFLVLTAFPPLIALKVANSIKAARIDGLKPMP